MDKELEKLAPSKQSAAKRDHMKGSRQNDGSPDELDYDWVTRSQEPDDVLKSVENWLKEAKTIINGDKATMTDREGSIVAELSKSNGKWLVDKLIN